MRPKAFFDVAPEERREKLMRVASRALREMHGIFRETPGQYALALPDHPRVGRGRLRIFAEKSGDLERLAYRLRELPVRFSDIANVPQDYSGPYRRYSRYRIQSRKQERDYKGTLRLRRMREAEAEQMPWFNMRSGSTGQEFRLYVSVADDAEGSLADSCEPDSYGLSVATRPFALPLLD
ncbi:CRISPR-associated protein (Cas_Csy4) [Thiorhodovibrio frisius]|uniref:CRISPR-associated protein (Cas_Csy4) n=2 Tax=Thiorhodovibrio frisius TaxID=631362 RepID=H8Z7X5_9GAMM|nr:CRISPR-associated protein (Cas_Csy4) [Thiorhodovibrio frisius]WPL22043.1 CRISPR-associated protein Cas6/Csy4, subtype I-F/YPEST [Thiorhodovibrio frisius]